METITIFPKNKKQQSLLKSLLEEMQVYFKLEKISDEALLTEEQFYKKIDRSVKQSEEGKVKRLPKEKQKELLGL
jgi:hypothetical protein